MEIELYRKMYARLCAGVSDAIDLLKASNNALYVSTILQKAPDEAEELYLSADDTEHLHEAT